MSSHYQGPKVFRDAVAALAKLPGIGEKTAQRLVFHLVRSEAAEVSEMLRAVDRLKKELRLCVSCWGYAEAALCAICADPARDKGLLCLVEDPSDLFAVERSSEYHGLYHVLHGRLSPLEGVGPGQLKTAELLARVEAAPPREVILATNPDVEGDATALYFARLLADKGVHATRLAMGIPMGGNLEYTDHVTLGRALTERRSFDSGSSRSR